MRALVTGAFNQNRTRIALMAIQTSSIAANLERVSERVARAAKRAGRSADEITIVAVSKTFPAETIRAAHEAGLRHFGENRIQEFEAKQATQLGFADAVWHFIGHLQSNKARRAVHLFDRIDSIDGIGLAQRVDAAAAEEVKRLPVLIEVRLGDEETKSGVQDSETLPLAETIQGFTHVELHGLMTIPPYSEDPEGARPYFRKLRELRDSLRSELRLQLPFLSMGMSHDFEVAIEEGASEIRIGTALFGERSKR
jgi:pyridoxal phosphate enzyme (YggS family)